MPTFILDHSGERKVIENTGMPNKNTSSDWRTTKRYLWLSSPLMPLLPLIGLGLYFWTGLEWVLAIPLFHSYIAVPILDGIFGEDEANPDEADIIDLENNLYYRRLTYLTVPAHFITLIALAVFVGTQDISIASIIILALTSGAYGGLAINTAHELGHKKTKLEQRLARITLAVTGYGHFTIDHNRGHHRNVATPLDHASSRMGETIYRFMLREVPGAMRGAWASETERLKRLQLPVLSVQNQILQSYFLTLLLFGSLLLMFGWVMLPFLFIHTAWAWFQLTSANYIEHYGLLREQLASGGYESCQPCHSWNANSIFSNLALFQLQRHSDHHANPTRRYQSLRDFPDIPQLPTGYFGMYVLSYFPSLWFAVMDKRLLATPHINGDLSKVNIDPKHRAEIFARYPLRT